MVVATEDKEILDDVRKNGKQAILTKKTIKQELIEFMKLYKNLLDK